MPGYSKFIYKKQQLLGDIDNQDESERQWSQVCQKIGCVSLLLLVVITFIIIFQKYFG